MSNTSYPREIYAIKHKITKRIYIGSTSMEIEDRYRWHMKDLKKGVHTSVLMQEDFNKYGEQYDVYRIGVINSREEKLKEYEEMIKHNTFDVRYGYNQGDAKRCGKIIRKLTEPPFPIKDDLSDLDDH